MKTHYKKWRKQASEYLGQWDLQRDDGSYVEPVVVIADVQPYRPEVPRFRKKPDGTYEPEPNKRYIISFQGKRKKWLAGPVSQDAIAAIHGVYIEDWKGKKITLYFDPTVQMKGIQVGGIRVRPTAPAGEPSAEPLDKPIDEAAADRIDQAREAAGFLEEGPQ